jgi:ubiquitin C-terminal hydrolase
LKTKNKEILEKNLLLEKERKNLYEENLLLKKTPILVGLNNIGATCYMNATLQCLSNTDELTKFFLNKFKYEPNDKNKIISNAYYNVIKDLWNRNINNKSFSPNEFKEKLSQENPLFAGIAANDSKDLINFLLERFHNELNEIQKDNIQYNNYVSYQIKPNDQLDKQKMLNIFTNEFKEKYNSIISNLFYGLLETKSQCQQCKYIKYNFQVYSFIEFPLERVNQYCFMTGKRNNYNMNNNKNPDIDLYECFEYYNNLELMTGDNQMYCNICNCNCDSLYGSLLYSTPNYLIINLNRGRGAVYECNVNFPEQLNLYNFVTFKNGNTVYELYAVICHIGPSSMSGHFIAFCKNRIDKKWYKYNDAFVTLCQNSNEYRSGMPYILFYKVLLSS